MAPDSLPGSFSGYRRGQDSNFPPPRSINRCCLLYIHLLCFAGDTDRGDWNGSPSHVHVPPPQLHAYIPVWLCKLTRPTGEDTDLACVGADGLSAVMGLGGDRADERVKLVCAGGRVKSVTRASVHGEQGRPVRLGPYGTELKCVTRAFQCRGWGISQSGTKQRV